MRTHCASLLLLFVKISVAQATSSSTFSHESQPNVISRADECTRLNVVCRSHHVCFVISLDVMTSAAVDGLKRSNVCGDGYRIEGALLKSYPYSKRESYLPYEDCSMTFKVG